MKKLIAISVLFALLAGFAFAEASVGGNLKISTDLIGGNEDDQWAGPLKMWDAYTNISWSGDNAGGMMRLHAFGSTSRIDWTPDAFVFWWWRPIEQLRLQLGKNPDGDWGHAQITGWGFNAEAQGGICIDQYRGIGNLAVVARTAAWAPGFNSSGMTVSINPVPGFNFNIGIPYAYNSTGELGDVYGNSYLHLDYTFEDIGTLKLAAQLVNEAKPDIHAAFYVMAIDNIGLEVGFAYGLESEVIEVGAGFRFSDGGDLTFKLRAGAVLADNYGVIGVGILPSYRTEAFTFFFNAGFGMDLEKDDDNIDWFVNPYISVPANSGRFYLGFKLSDNEGGGINWSLPIGWNVYF